jgi:hypothetical protein
LKASRGRPNTDVKVEWGEKVKDFCKSNKSGDFSIFPNFVETKFCGEREASPLYSAPVECGVLIGDGIKLGPKETEPCFRSGRLSSEVLCG